MKLQKRIGIWSSEIKKEVYSHKLIYIFLATILLLSLFVRIYRTEDLLGFYYDQGRDALVIWKLWHSGKLFLTGPVTGLAGIFLGPFYYYLIAPFYLIGGGDPRFPAIFLAITTVLALMILYKIGMDLGSRATGLIAVIIGSFSFYLVQAGRWLSNPTPMFLISVLLLWVMQKITIQKNTGNNFNKNYLWILLALLLGVSLQFESASAVFYLPMIVVFALWQRKNLPEKKLILISICIFLMTLIPQVLFNFRHDNLIFDSFKRVLAEEKSFRSPLNPENVKFKKEYFRSVFNSKIFPGHIKSAQYFYISSVIGFLFLLKNKKKKLIFFLIFLGVPMMGYFIFQGNEGHIYDYYMTGYYLPMILMFSLGLGALWNNVIGKIIVLLFLTVFLNVNLPLLRNFLNSSIMNSGMVTLGSELASVDWIFGNSKAYGNFNVDIYVPPVIPHSYEYLLLWRGNKFCGQDKCGLTTEKNVPVLYTLFEDDPPHPERLQVWLEKQKATGRIEEQIRFGNITVQRRIRI